MCRRFLRIGRPSLADPFLTHGINDPRIIRLIQKWLKAGILEDGVVAISDKGTGQGSVASPLGLSAGDGAKHPVT